MIVVSRSVLWVSQTISPVVLVGDIPPIFSLLGWWFFPLFISPSFSFLVFKVSGDGSPWSPANGLFPITELDELPLDIPKLDSI